MLLERVGLGLTPGFGPWEAAGGSPVRYSPVPEKVDRSANRPELDAEKVVGWWCKVRGVD